MDQTFRTIIYASLRFEVDELLQVRSELGKLLGKEFLKSAEHDEQLVNKVVSISFTLSMKDCGKHQYQDSRRRRESQETR